LAVAKKTQKDQRRAAAKKAAAMVAWATPRP
jgi:hypothetical protein